VKQKDVTQEESQPVIVLTIAGSDSGGAAGLQADLKTLTALGVYGMSVITAVTAQNSVRVEAVSELPAVFVAAQLNAVLSDYGASAVKTGFIGRSDLIATIARHIQEYRLKHVVIDPVLVDHRGQAMFSPEVTQAYIAQLLPLADVVTPNRHEAALLAGIPLPESISPSWLRNVAERIYQHGPNHVLIKGGRDAAESVDLLFDGKNHAAFTSPWIDTQNTHGAGDTLSAALGAYLAQGRNMKRAVMEARRFTYSDIVRAAGWRLGEGHGPVAQVPLWHEANPFDPTDQV